MSYSIRRNSDVDIRRLERAVEEYPTPANRTALAAAKNRAGLANDFEVALSEGRALFLSDDGWICVIHDTLNQDKDEEGRTVVAGVVYNENRVDKDYWILDPGNMLVSYDRPGHVPMNIRSKVSNFAADYYISMHPNTNTRRNSDDEILRLERSFRDYPTFQNRIALAAAKNRAGLANDFEIALAEGRVVSASGNDIDDTFDFDTDPHVYVRRHPRDNPRRNSDSDVRALERQVPTDPLVDIEAAQRFCSALRRDMVPRDDSHGALETISVRPERGYIWARVQGRDLCLTPGPLAVHDLDSEPHFCRLGFYGGAQETRVANAFMAYWPREKWIPMSVRELREKALDRPITRLVKLLNYWHMNLDDVDLISMIVTTYRSLNDPDVDRNIVMERGFNGRFDDTVISGQVGRFSVLFSYQQLSCVIDNLTNKCYYNSPSVTTSKHVGAFVSRIGRPARKVCREVPREFLLAMVG